MVTSTMLEAKESEPPIPRKVSARAPITIPPSCENGRSSPAHSRTALPQTKFANRFFSCGGTSANHAAPSTTNNVAPDAHRATNPPQPTANIADAIECTPTAAASHIASANPTSAAKITPMRIGKRQALTRCFASPRKQCAKRANVGTTDGRSSLQS